MNTPEIGDTRVFTPAAFTSLVMGHTMTQFTELDVEVRGEVVYVNRAHRYCRVRYDLGGLNGAGYECFKF